MKKEVIFIEWSTHGRDFEIIFPLIYFFENILKWNTHYISIFNIPKILSTNPDIVIMSNTTGADVNYKIAKMIKKSNTLFFSHVSEGMFTKDNIEGFLWGWNSKKKFNENLSMLWSKKSYDISIAKYTYLKSQLKVSGSLGHDKYKLYTQQKIINKKYRKTIGYAAFNFENAILNETLVIEKYGLEFYKKHNNYIDITNNILKYLIQNNPEILFILKNHPGSSGNLSLELHGLENYKNVMIINSEYSIVDVIASSDIWLNYRSSTNLEAWLLDKPSISFAMEEDLLAHTEVCYGSIIENSPIKVNTYIKEFYCSNKITAFEKKEKIREQLIEDMIGFSDGLNHIRFISFLKPYIQKIENGEVEKGKWNISLEERLKGYIKHMVYSFSKGQYNTPYIRKWATIYDMFDDQEIEEQKRMRYPSFDKFYKNNQQKIEDIYKNYSFHWKKELNLK